MSNIPCKIPRPIILRLKKVGFLLLYLSILTACNNVQSDSSSDATQADIMVINEIVDGHNSRTSLDWAGTYEGTLPCIDCDGIKTTLVLKEDGSYSLAQTYLKGQTGDREEESGSFEWDNAGYIITLTSDDMTETTRYRVGENRLIMLDEQGEPMTGKQAERYVLDKTSF